MRYLTSFLLVCISCLLLGCRASRSSVEEHREDSGSSYVNSDTVYLSSAAVVADDSLSLSSEAQEDSLAGWERLILDRDTAGRIVSLSRSFAVASRSSRDASSRISSLRSDSAEFMSSRVAAADSLSFSSDSKLTEQTYVKPAPSG